MKLPATKEDLYSAYILKKDLIAWCRENNLPVSGSKENLLKNIENLIEGKPAVKEVAKKNSKFIPSISAVIDPDYRNNEIHRAFFKSVIGKHFKFYPADTPREKKRKKLDEVVRWNKY
jgi:hypothetical protein